jgi:hypothetical protein
LHSGDHCPYICTRDDALGGFLDQIGTSFRKATAAFIDHGDLSAELSNAWSAEEL